MGFVSEGSKWMRGVVMVLGVLWHTIMVCTPVFRDSVYYMLYVESG